MSNEYNYLRCRLPVVIEPKTICKVEVVARDEEYRKTTISEGENHLCLNCGTELDGGQDE